MYNDKKCAVYNFFSPCGICMYKYRWMCNAKPILSDDDMEWEEWGKDKTQEKEETIQWKS
jgi:hypothetical protein